MHYDSISSTSRRSTAIDNQQHSIEFMVLVLTDNHRRWITEYLRKKKNVVLACKQIEPETVFSCTTRRKKRTIIFDFCPEKENCCRCKTLFVSYCSCVNNQSFSFPQKHNISFFSIFSSRSFSHVHTQTYTHTEAYECVCVWMCICVMGAHRVCLRIGLAIVRAYVCMCECMFAIICVYGERRKSGWDWLFTRDSCCLSMKCLYWRTWNRFSSFSSGKRIKWHIKK